MLRRLTVAAVVASIVLAAAGCLTPLTSQPPLAPVPASASPLVGVYEPGAPGSCSQIAEFADATGVKPGIVVYYSPWSDEFSTSFAQTAWGHGAYVLVQLQPEGVTLASIAAGGSDAYLRAYADDVVAFGHSVILSFGHERTAPGTHGATATTTGPPTPSARCSARPSRTSAPSAAPCC